MKSALIGYTGFVGSNILRSAPFDDVYNSSNIGEIAGREYDLVVSAANGADSFRINEHPDEDLASIDAFADILQTVTIGKLALISTVCVYAARERADAAPQSPASVASSTSAGSDEDTPITTDDITPYGRNRYHLEQLARARYDTRALRLPQLYGPGLKKGIIYDLINDYRVEFIRPKGVFQYYPLDRLWSDLQVALKHDLPVLNLATAPVTSETVARECFGIDISGQQPAAPESRFSQLYTRNMTTKYAGLFGREGDYLLTEEEELQSIAAFRAATLDATL